MKKDDYVYQCFMFKNAIKQRFYAGDEFLMHRKGMNMEESLELAHEIGLNKDAFMPGLVRKIEELLGKGNFVYDFWEFGDDDFSLYWYIKKGVYHEKMELIRKWVQFEEIEELIWFEKEEI